MNDQQLLTLIELLGDDAKTAFIAYLVIDYGSLWVIVALCAWGIRTVWEKRSEWSL